MLTAQFYVGSRPAFDAWERLPIGPIYGDVRTVEHVTGAWEGDRENTAIISGAFHTVRGVLRFAAWLSTISGNDCVLTVCDVAGQAWGATRPGFTRDCGARRVEVTPAGLERGSINIWHAGYTIPREGSPYTFVREPEAAFIAVTVTPGGDVSPV